MKKVLLSLVCVFFLVGCSAEEEKQETPEKEQAQIVENAVYTTPVAPTSYQIEQYSALSEALDGSEQETIAELVASNFAIDFFTLSNKDSAMMVGGTTFIPLDYSEEFTTFAQAYVYAQYPVLVETYGTDELPEVSGIEVVAIEETSYLYNDVIEENVETGQVASVEEISVDGYEVQINITYADTKVSQDELKTSTTVLVANIEGRFSVLGIE